MADTALHASDLYESFRVGHEDERRSIMGAYDEY